MGQTLKGTGPKNGTVVVFFGTNTMATRLYDCDADGNWEGTIDAPNPVTDVNTYIYVESLFNPMDFQSTNVTIKKKESRLTSS